MRFIIVYPKKGSLLFFCYHFIHKYAMKRDAASILIINICVLGFAFHLYSLRFGRDFCRGSEKGVSKIFVGGKKKDLIYRGGVRVHV